MKKTTLLYLALILGFISCNSNQVFKEQNKNFPSHRWAKSDVKTFSPTITDTVNPHSIYLELRHVHGYQFTNMKVNITLVKPSGKVCNRVYSMQVMKTATEYYSDCAEDICDLKVKIEEHLIFTEPGVYKYTIEHDMPVDPVPNVMEFGLIIEKEEGE